LFASKISEISDDKKTIEIEIDKETVWKTGDNVCVLRAWEEIACAKITKIEKQKAWATFEKAQETLETGDWVQSAKNFTPPSTTPIPLPELSSDIRLTSLHNHLLGTKIQMDLNAYWMTGIHYQFLATRHLALGLEGFYMPKSLITGVSMTGYSGGITASLYSSRRYAGLFVQAGFQANQIKWAWSGIEEEVLTPEGSLAIGARVRVLRRLTLGMGLRFSMRPEKNFSPLSTKIPQYSFGFHGDLSVPF